MPMKLVTNEGETLFGLTYADLTRKLWQSARARPDSKLTYMSEVSQRVNTQFASEVRTERCRLFLSDLERSGLIRLTLDTESEGNP